MSGRHHRQRTPRNRGWRAVRWRPGPTSGEALVAGGTAIIIIGGFVTVFTRTAGFIVIGVGFALAAYGLTGQQ